MYVYKATIRSVYDGDTFRADLHLGFGIVDRGANGKGRAFRLMDIDTPELRGEERIHGLGVRDYVRVLMPIGSSVIIKSVKDESGKYGRYLAYVKIFDKDDNVIIDDLTEHLIEKGYGVEVIY